MAVSRAAIVGWGDVAIIHHEAIVCIEGVDLVGVVDTDAERREAATAALGVPAFASVAELVDAVAPDVVHITTPHHQHITPTLEALERGVHVIQEKPLAASIEDGQRLVDVMARREAQGLTSPKVGICFQNRYNVASQELRRLLDSGELGAVHGAYASVVWTRTADYYKAKPWRGSREESGGGLLINQAIHTLDLVQWFMGDVVDVAGHVATHRFGDVSEVEDTAEMLLTHASGLKTAFYATLTAPQHRPVELELDCDNAYVSLRNGLSVTWKDGRGTDRYEERQAPSGGRSYWGVSHELLVRDFYAKVDDPEPFWISPAEAMKSLQILKATYQVSGF
ncbi:Gfo/Idh/MocA family oxidoreductase [Propioniciclava sp. MC1595]|uniref:Gfo/Idh/MocA family protein n=1 Tax=Propioniciclava sp. MC1595 TaxID=2760308 RepID=UPI00166247A1|nr:Gfo/Idh/MocA family oxidoreductase [Propioniciclava sp. MC1595]MBB1494853.1 Gfo/Idh/MocA family oxidoreductase [Propioniciclava sp. MC1595]QTE25917.1 Gfo/Idh/MocA family oxidoreductase [Propioniciclava sp. MC1595]